MLVDQSAWGTRPHSPGVRASIIIEDPLVILCCDQWHRVLAISDAGANNAGDVPPYFERSVGAVYVYRRGATPSAWTLRNVVKAPNLEYGDNFGASVSLSASGRTLAVGAPQEDSNARGIDGDRTDNSTRNAGAAYLY